MKIQLNLHELSQLGKPSILISNEKFEEVKFLFYYEISKVSVEMWNLDGPPVL